MLRGLQLGEPDGLLRGIELLGAAAVEIAAEERELVTELVDELRLLPERGEQLRAILPQILGVGGQRNGRRRHRHLYQRAAFLDRFPVRGHSAILVWRGSHARDRTAMSAVARSASGGARSIADCTLMNVPGRISLLRTGSQMRKRKSVAKDVETRLLVESRRRCCLCFSLEGDLGPKKIQIAHISRDPGDSEYENLVVLCLAHHDEYDSATSQSKGFTADEVQYWKRSLVEEMSKLGSAPGVIATESCVACAGRSDHNEVEPSGERAVPGAIEVVAVGGRLFVMNADNTRGEIVVDGQIAHPVLSPDRMTVAFLRGSARPKIEVAHGLVDANDIWIVDVDGRNARCLVQSIADTDMKKVLAGLQAPQFSPDARSLFFLSHAWVTSHAVHRFDFRTGEVSFVCPGNSLHVVASGEFAGYLVVQQHRYFWGGGSYDWYWLVTQEGKSIEPVGAEPGSLAAFLEMTSSGRDV